jgi:pimeloyl-ACP methyl ester carboxylesterase
MTRTVLVAGGPRGLGPQLAAGLINQGHEVAIWPGEHGTWSSADVSACSASPAAAGKVRSLAPWQTPADIGPVDIVWCLAAGTDPVIARGRRTDGSTTAAVLSALPLLRPGMLCHVGPAWLSGQRADARPEIVDGYLRQREAVSARCTAMGLALRALSVGSTISDTIPDGGTGGLAHFISTVLTLLADIAERDPDYLNRRPLSFLAAPDAGLEMLPAAEAARALLRAAERRTGAATEVTASSWFSAADLAARLTAELGAPLRVTHDPAELNPVDRLFQSRLGTVHRELAAGTRLNAAIRPADDGAVRYFNRAVRAVAIATPPRRPTTTSLPTFLDKVQVGPLTYLRAGHHGTPIVLLNAFGVGPMVWYRLVEQLLPRRVLLWTSRSAETPFSAHLADIGAMLTHEGVTACHLVGWCSGAYTALEFARTRNEAVATVTLLNGSLHSPDDDPQLVPAFRRNADLLCRMLIRNPRAASALTSAFGALSAVDKHTVADEHDPEQQGRAVLSWVDPVLRREFQAAMQVPQDLLAGAHLRIEIRGREPLRDPVQLSLPILGIGGEYDDISSPLLLQAQMRKLPDARYAEVQGGTHFMLHDRAPLIGSLIGSFIADPASRGDHDGEVRWQPESPGPAEQGTLVVQKS